MNWKEPKKGGHQPTAAPSCLVELGMGGEGKAERDGGGMMGGNNEMER